MNLKNTKENKVVRMVERVFVAVFMVLAMSLPASVYAKDPMVSTMDAFLITVDKKGKEKARPAKEAEPGQVIEYRIKQKNISKDDLSGLVVTGPVPTNTQYLGKSAKTAEKHKFVVSIDYGRSYESEPVKRTIKDENGKDKVIIIPPEKYTHVRWIPESPLKKGKHQEFRYRVKIN